MAKNSHLPKSNCQSLFVRIEEVVYFSAEEKYVTIHAKDGKTYLNDLSLKSLEEKMGDKFLRIHRALLVNVPDQGDRQTFRQPVCC